MVEELEVVVLCTFPELLVVGLSICPPKPEVGTTGELQALQVCQQGDQSHPEGHRLYQDNDPKHTSKYIQEFFDMNRISWWKSPAESPDLNPIEKIWGSMKTYLRDKHKPRNLEELKEGIRAYWKKLTPEVCTRYIDHLQKVMPVVVAEQGAPSGH